MGNNSVPKFIFRLSRFTVYMGSVLGRFYCTWHGITGSYRILSRRWETEGASAMLLQNRRLWRRSQLAQSRIKHASLTQSTYYVGVLINFASTVIFLFTLDVSGWNRFCVVAWYLSFIILHLEHTDAYSPHHCTSKWRSFQTFGSNSVLLLNS